MTILKAAQKTSRSTGSPPDSHSFLRRLKEHPDYQATLSDPYYFSQSILGLSSPLNLPDLERAVEYLQKALDQSRPICVLGDRDVDGVSSTALLGGFLRERHRGPLELMVSDQGDDYGLSGELFTRIRASQAALVILLDMGSSHGPEIEQLIEKGKEVIILDHHQLHARLPDAARCAFVNPQRNKKQHSGHKGKIATAGLVFKLLFAMGLSYIQAWKQICLLEASGEWYAFRCGLYLGSFSSPEACVAWEQEEYPDKKEPWEHVFLKRGGDGPYAFSSEEWEKWEELGQDPTYVARLLLARTVEERPRLCNFVRCLADLAALGTLTDMVPLVDENRTLVRIGIGQTFYERKRGQRLYRTGYAALVRAMGLNQERLLSRDLAWSIGPALNAAGRMGNSRLALDLLLCSQEAQARQLAGELVQLNESRKRRTKRNEKLIEKHFEKHQNKLEHPILFCYHPRLEPGVSGIIATRLSEQYQKPVIYINNDDGYARGSARTWNDFNVLELLNTAASLFIQFGGHPEAAGFSIAYENIDALERSLLRGYNKIALQNSQEQKPPGDRYSYALELKPGQLNYYLLGELESLEPFGSHNPEPTLKLASVRPLGPHYMSNGLHVSFQIAGTPPNLSFIAWRKGEQVKEAIEAGCCVDIFGCLEISHFRGRREFRFRAEEIIEV